jgi:MFS family permease
VLLGAILQLATPWGTRKLGSLRRWVVFASTTQALALVPLAIMAITGRASLWTVFCFATIYWAASMGCGAGWSTWIGMIVPHRLRARYFSFKSRLSHAASLAGLVTGGLILQRYTGNNEHLWPFAVLFLIAAAGRVGCSYYLHRQQDTGPIPDHHREVPASDLFRRLRSGRDGRFILFMALMQVGVQIGQPFFPPFTRARLNMSYEQILALIGAAFLTKALMQPAWGAFAHRFGAARLLWIGGLGIVPTPSSGCCPPPSPGSSWPSSRPAPCGPRTSWLSFC